MYWASLRKQLIEAMKENILENPIVWPEAYGARARLAMRSETSCSTSPRGECVTKKKVIVSFRGPNSKRLKKILKKLGHGYYNFREDFVVLLELSYALLTNLLLEISLSFCRSTGYFYHFQSFI